LGHDEDGHQGPLRLLQIETKRQPKRQSRGEKCLDCELQRQRGWREKSFPRATHWSFFQEFTALLLTRKFHKEAS
jgi:hypothetical protein